MNILITGGAGNIGSVLAQKLSEIKNLKITIVDNLLTGKVKNIPTKENVTFIKCDVNNYDDIAAIFFTRKFDYVFHYAAVVGVQRTLRNPLWVLEDVKGIENLLKLSKNTVVKRIFYASSSEVYGEPFEIPQNEKTTPLNSRLPYAVVKNMGESYFKSYHQEYGLSYTIFRFFNTYGPNQSTDFVIPRFIKQALLGEDLIIYGDGLQTRTFCHVNDNIAASTLALFENKYCNDVINIGSDKEITILELAQTIIKVTNSTSKIVHGLPLEEGDMSRRCPDITRMRKLLGRELISLEDGICQLIGSSGFKNYWRKDRNNEFSLI